MPGRQLLVHNLAVLVSLGLGSSALADPVADFYKGKELRLVISTAAGTGYDTYARAVGRNLSRHLPGNPTIVPQNMPGAGGILAANYLYGVAPKDGTAFGMIQNTVPFEPLFENKAAKFDSAKFNWLGTPTTEVGLYIVYHTSKIKTLRDAQTHEVIAGVTGTASTPALYGRLFNQVLHMKTKLVAGYPSQLDLLLALEKGEMDAMTSPFWSSLKIERPKWYPEKTVRIFFQYGAAPNPELNDVPFARNLVENEADRTLLDVATAPLGTGRPMTAPPGVPPERVKALRDAFEATFKDPAFVAECAKLGIECSDTRNGEELSAFIQHVYAAPEDIKKRLVAIQRGQ
jgi:tripartite-type tricarboxylate transporter receptor subunit TctC